jgi:hypothetical protein
VLYSYVVRWDHGFAPNPFHGFCTVATCKPSIRKKAKEGHWVLGTGGAKRGYAGKAIFLMRITKIETFDSYWLGERYKSKKPTMNGSLEQRFGDNIYHRDAAGVWVQADSRHSWDGDSNDINLKRDTAKTDRVLVSDKFTYWGENAPTIPAHLKEFVISRPGWKDDFSQERVAELVAWAKTEGGPGLLGDPIEWKYERYWR